MASEVSGVSGSKLQDTSEESKHHDEISSRPSKENSDEAKSENDDTCDNQPDNPVTDHEFNQGHRVNISNEGESKTDVHCLESDIAGTEQKGNTMDIPIGDNLTPDTLLKINSGETSSEQTTIKISEIVDEDTSENLKHEEDDMPNDIPFEANSKNDDDSNNQSDKGDNQITYPLDENREFKQDSDNVINKSNEGQETNTDCLKLDIAGTEKTGSPKEVLTSNIHPDSKEDTHVSYLEDENREFNEDNDKMNNRINEDQEDFLESDNTGKEQASSTEVPNSGYHPNGKDDTHASNPVNENREFNDQVSNEGQDSTTDLLESKIASTEQPNNPVEVPNIKKLLSGKDDTQVSHPVNEYRELNQDRESKTGILESHNTGAEQAGSSTEVPNSGYHANGKDDTHVSDPVNENREFNDQVSNEGQDSTTDLLESGTAGTEQTSNPVEVPNVKNLPSGKDDTQVSNPVNEYRELNQDRESKTDFLELDNTGTEQAGSSTEVPNSGYHPNGKDDAHASDPVNATREFNDQGINEDQNSTTDLLKSETAGTEQASNPEEVQNIKNLPSGKDDDTQDSYQVNSGNKDQETKTALNDSDIASREQAGSPVAVQNSSNKLDGKCDIQVSNLPDEKCEFNKGSDQVIKSNEDQESNTDFLGSNNTGTEQAGSSTEVLHSGYHPNGKGDTYAFNPVTENRDDQGINEDQNSTTDLLKSETAGTEQASNPEEVQNIKNLPSGKDDDTQDSYQVNSGNKDQETKTALNDSDIASREQAGSPVAVQNSSNKLDGKCDIQVSNLPDEKCEFNKGSDQVIKSNEDQESNTDFLGSNNTGTEQAGSSTEVLHSGYHPNGKGDTYAFNPVTENRDDQGINEDQDSTMDLLESETVGTEQESSPVEVLNTKNLHSGKDDDTQDSYQVSSGNKDQESKTDLKDSHIKGEETSSEQTTSKSSEIVIEDTSENLKHEEGSMPNDNSFEANPKNDDYSNNQTDKGDTQISYPFDENREFKQDSDKVNTKTNEGQETNTDCLKLDIVGTDKADSLKEVQNSNIYPDSKDDTHVSYLEDENHDFKPDNRVSEGHQGTETQQPMSVKEKYSEMNPSAGFQSKIYNRDCERFRKGYPDDEVDNENLQNNWLFYRNEIKFLPRGENIDTIHEKWKGDYNRLEANHCYIQWLFPIREQGVNYLSQILQPHEAKKIKSSGEARKRVINSLELMLDFYGISVKKINTRDIYTLCRSDNWESRFKHLNSSFHNWQRITRILKCMCELGFVDVQPPLIWFFFNEIFVTKNLSRAEISFKEYWLQTLKNDNMRLYIEEQAENIKLGASPQFSDEFLILPNSFTDAKDQAKSDQESDNESLQEMNQEQSKDPARVNQETDADGESSGHEEDTGGQKQKRKTLTSKTRKVADAKTTKLAYDFTPIYYLFPIIPNYNNIIIGLYLPNEHNRHIK